MQILFTGDDLARVRLSPTLDPFEEIQISAHDPIRRQDPVLSGWVAGTAARLGPGGPAIVQKLRSPLVQFTGLGIKPDGSIPFDVQLERALSQPTSRWRSDAAEVQSYGLPIDPDLSDGKPEALSALAEALRTFHDAAIAPHWTALYDAGAAAVATWTQIMSRSGVEGLLRSLHADASWSPPVLTLERPELPCPPGCGHPRGEAVADKMSGLKFRVSERGLTIVPSVFRTNCAPLVVFDPSRGFVAEILTVPIPASWELFADRQIDHRTDPLAHLLGATRSWVLRACATDELTTSELARAVGISVSSASEHSSALRAAGLITSHREGNLVLHRSTPIGLTLQRSTNQPVHSGAANTDKFRPSKPSKPATPTPAVVDAAAPA